MTGEGWGEEVGRERRGGQERRLAVCDGDVQMKLKRRSMDTLSQARRIFCSGADGRLHTCATMTLDLDL